MGNAASAAPFRETIGVEVAPATPGSSAVHRNHNYEKELQHLPFPDQPHVNVLYKAFEESVGKHAANPCMGIRSHNDDGTRGDYVYETYGEVSDKVDVIGTGLSNLGLTTGSTIGVYSINRPEWIYAAISAWRQGCTVVPLYDTLGATAVEYILADAKVSLAFVAKVNTANLIEAAAKVDSVNTIVQFEAVDTAQLEAAKAAGVTLVSLADFMTVGEDKAAPVETDPESLAYIMYTSGTTGNPKGVMLSHKNILASVTGLKFAGVDLSPDDVYFSYLPLAHCFETALILLGTLAGGRVGFYQGNVKLLTEDMALCQPTILAGVPRVYSRIYDKVMMAVQEKSWLAQKLVSSAMDAQREYLAQGTRSAFWDTLVLNKIKARLGGRVRIMCTGAAPMPAHIMEFLKVTFGCLVLQGYGLTENAAAAMGTPVDYSANGNVGCPFASCEVKVVDVPEMNYKSTDTPNPRGEVCIRGPIVCKGYYGLPEKTAETIDADGWLHTGDIGQFLPDGALQIIDRKKNIFKLAQGEYVAAEELEGIFGQSVYVNQLWIYGNSFHVQLIGVVVPNPETVLPWAAENGIEGDIATVAASPEYKKLVMDDFKRIGKAKKLAGFKFPKEIIVEGELDELMSGFNVQNNCMTPTFKLKRPQLLKRYQAQIDAAYEQLGN